MANHSDPTANAAIGSVNREWKQMLKRAIALRKANRELSPEERYLFTGIYGQLLKEPVNVLENLYKKGNRE